LECKERKQSYCKFAEDKDDFTKLFFSITANRETYIVTLPDQ